MNKEIILQEIESLIRTMDFVQEEQAFIKKKLISFLENIVMNDAVIWAEDLSQEIINRETAIQLLKRDILVLKSNVRNKKSVNNIMDPSTTGIYKKYKQQVGYIETEFVNWKHLVNEKMDSTSY
jgi:hypothetical protein